MKIRYNDVNGLTIRNRRQAREASCQQHRRDYAATIRALIKECRRIRKQYADPKAAQAELIRLGMVPKIEHPKRKRVTRTKQELSLRNKHKAQRRRGIPAPIGIGILSTRWLRNVRRTR